jgi:hypothetical protein
MRAALEIDIPNYANAMETTKELGGVPIPASELARFVNLSVTHFLRGLRADQLPFVQRVWRGSSGFFDCACSSPVFAEGVSMRPLALAATCVRLRGAQPSPPALSTAGSGNLTQSRQALSERAAVGQGAPGADGAVPS